MWQVSAGFLTALAASHTIGVRVEVWAGLPAPAKLAELTSPAVVVDGQVGVDVNNAVRRTLNVTLTDPTGSLTPAAGGDLLTPYGNELRVYRGITWPQVSDGLIPLGVFGISTVDIDDDPNSGLTISLGAYDRSRKVSRAKLADAYGISAGVDVGAAIQTLLTAQVPGLTFNFPPSTGATTPALAFNAGDDPWQQAQAMAASVGYDLHFDQAGVCVLTPIVDPTTGAVAASYVEGAGATILKSTRKLTDEQTFNDVIASGNSTSNATPPVGRAQDTNPTSPTYIGGQYGDVVEFYTSDLITSSAQALASAQGLLYRAVGLSEQIAFDAIVNPAHDVGDVVRVARARSKISNTYVIDALTIPLKADTAMQATTRRQTS